MWAMRTLRPYLEGLRFKVRTDHATLRQILNITESTGRLTRWRLLLSELDYEIDHIPGRVNSVPDALSRVLTPGGDPQPVEADVPVFESNDHCDADCDHAKVLLTPRNQSRAVAQKQTNGPTAPSGPPIPGVDTDGAAQPSSDKTLGEPGPAADVDFDIFDFDVQQDGDVIPDARDLQSPPTNAEILEEQRGDAFCIQVLTEQDSRHRNFHEGPDGILLRRHPVQPDLAQIVLPRVLRPRVLRLCHYSLLAVHPRLNRMYYHIRRIYYWPHMAADVAATIRNCAHCARNRVNLRKHTNDLKLFPAEGPLQAISMDILGPLPRTERGKRFLLVINDRFSKLTAVVPLRTTNAYSVAIAFCEAWIFKRGPPESVLTDNGKQFASRFFQSVCKLLGLNNVYISAYHPQANGRAERYNRTLQNMLMCFVEEHHDSCDKYASTLTSVYNCHVHRSTGTTPFDLILSRPPPAFSLHRSLRGRPEPDSRDRHEFLIALDETTACAYNRLKKAQARYKKNFDKRVRRTNVNIGPGDYVFLDHTDGSKKKGKLQSLAEGPSGVQKRSDRTFTIDRKGAMEVINSDRGTKAPRPHNAPAFVPEPGQLNKVTDGPEYTIQKILKQRVAAGYDQFELLIKWADYEDPS